ncbi:uncharacterized protein METZ01_LOCUS84219 [marine metagenome]|uniref:prolyl oligopeptidase n=1 Tax=marine metagenome TaxID=408172 RepID=A0A381UT69_9ZZZZ
MISALFVFTLHKTVPVDVRYPHTDKVDVADTYFDTTISDPYRWLEDDHSKSTMAWVDKQNSFTNSYMRRIPFRRKIAKRLQEIWNYPSQGLPFKEGDKYYYFKNDGLQNQSVMYVQDTPNGEPEIFLNPNTFSRDGTIALGGIHFSPDHKYMGYSINNAGSDWQEFYILNLLTGERLPDHLEWVKFSGMAWRGNGFYYKKYPTPDEEEEFSGSNENAKVFYHRLGTSQSSDELIFYDPKSPKISPGISVTDDGRFLFLYRSSGTYGVSLAFRDTQYDQQKWTSIVDDYTCSIGIIDHIDGQLIARTDRNSPYKKIVRIDPEKPQEEHWVTLIEGTKEDVLSYVQLVGGKLLAHFTKDIISLWKVYDLNGKYLYDVELPGKGIVNGFGGKKDQMLTWYSFNNSVNPPMIYQYDITENRSKVYRESEARFNRENYVLKQEYYSSKDGTMVPIFITHKKDLEMDGKRPTLLYGYGGFNISIKPYFNKANSILLENNGVYVIANLRGGSEYGQEWHESGMLLNKQNVFDDFIYAAEYLFEKGITSPDYLAIKGGSNGGLLIGAVLNQRPDICKVAFPEVGVMDMLRYERFTIGHAWAVEYGSVDEKEHFENLVGYSPLHTIRVGTEYPSVLIYTADHDDRVVPAHSFKYAATLQSAQVGKDPILIRIGKSAGHGAGKPTKKKIEEVSEKWAFMFYEMGVGF